MFEKHCECQSGGPHEKTSYGCANFYGMLAKNSCVGNRLFKILAPVPDDHHVQDSNFMRVDLFDCIDYHFKTLWQQVKLLHLNVEFMQMSVPVLMCTPWLKVEM